jgi:DNA replication protein DnaC
VLVVDEVGYLTYGTDVANVLFHVVNERHRRKRSMIFTKRSRSRSGPRSTAVSGKVSSSTTSLGKTGR